MPSSRRTLIWSALAIFLFAELLFLVGIQFPRGTNFDEFHYVPAAKMYLEGTGFRNLEHPPFAKALIAVGMAIGGDRPFGWRLMSTLFGSLTLLGVFFWANVLFRNNLRLSLFVTGVTLANHLLFVQARIAMLDTFMTCFLVWGCALFCWAWETSLGETSLGEASLAPPPAGQSKKKKKLAPRSEPSPRVFQALLGSGICFGLATGCKWFGFVGWLGCLGLAFLCVIARRLKITGLVDAWPNWSLREVWLSLGLGAFIAYWASYLPLYLVSDAHYSLSRFFTLHPEMWDAQQRVPGNHNYKSLWTQWPLLQRPMWYQFDSEPTQLTLVRGVALIGNPWLMWSGFVAMIACTWSWIRHQSRQAFWIVGFYALFYLSWAVIPRALTFYYYYYPAGMLLGLAIAYTLRTATDRLRGIYLGFTVLVFIYFYPILAALRIPSASFTRWMWLRSWI